jgi:Tfp pilus assembly protein PilN
MTVRINFLPPSYQPPRKLGARDYLVVGAVAAAVALGSVYYGNGYAELQATQARVETAQRQLSTVRERVADLEDVRAREQRVARAEIEIQSLKGRAWSTVLLGLRDLTPQRMYWTEFEVEDARITISGSAARLIDLAQFIVGLMSSPLVAQVDLQVTTETGAAVMASVTPGESFPALPLDCTVCRLTFTLTINLQPQSEGGETA